jgi:7-carboxy-7-deazaguanine synthase
LWSQVTIVCSPKAGKINPVTELYTAAFKYVLSHDSVDPVDGLPILALNHSASPRVARPTSKGQPVYLQPMDAKDDTINALNVEAVKQSCMTHGYILQLQTHKIINVA